MRPETALADLSFDSLIPPLFNGKAAAQRPFTEQLLSFGDTAGGSGGLQFPLLGWDAAFGASIDRASLLQGGLVELNLRTGLLPPSCLMRTSIDQSSPDPRRGVWRN
jgi:hypothetical protein